MIFLRAILAWILIIGGCFGLFNHSAGIGLICILIGVALHWFNISSKRRVLAKRSAIQSAMLNAAGVTPNTGFNHAEEDSGIALNREARTLTLLSDGKWKTYPFSDIREWKTNLTTPDRVFAVGGNAVQMGTIVGANITANERAALATGLFVTVKDIEFPKWRIAMANETTQARWMEILRQEINEDR